MNKMNSNIYPAAPKIKEINHWKAVKKTNINKFHLPGYG